MKETEKIEIMHFDQEGYLEDGKALYETGKKMTALADKVADEGYDAVFLMGVGGTWDELMQLEYLMNKFGDRDLEVYLIHAAEWNVMGHKRMTEKSVVLTASESGTTPEVLEAVKKMKGMGVRVYAMTKPEGPIGQAVGAENCVAMASDHGNGGCEMGYYLADCFGLRLLNRRGCFPKFDLFIEQTKDIWKDMLDIRKRFEPRAEELARKYALADYTMFIGSGALWGETILFSMCILEEMQWKRTRYITSADFFHGTLELVEPGVPVFLFMGEDECRAWTIKRGTKAPQAAGKIHSDFERGFIKAEVIGYDDYIELGGEQGAKAAGKLRIEGKDYVMADGDVVHFRFNV